MATYLFSENRELKNIQDGDVVVNDCEDDRMFEFYLTIKCAYYKLKVDFKTERNIIDCKFYTAHFTRIQTEPQTAPDIPVPCRSN